MVRLKEPCISRWTACGVMFQFLMVRLKAQIKNISDVCVRKFQFLMVRLKDSIESNITPIYSFQFLMVRLKVFSVMVLAEVAKAVSIPYGTIKSLSVYLWATYKSVSIPYGTIKRKDKIRFLYQVLFQFLMVRLKDLICKKNKSLILLPLRYYKDRKNKRIKCRW